jgi:transposase
MHGKGAALMLPYADTQAMQLHLDEISSQVTKGAHGVVLMDRAGWHRTPRLRVPANLTIILLPSRSPELNSVGDLEEPLVGWRTLCLDSLREGSEAVVVGQGGFFDVDERLQALLVAGDPLERLAAVVDFELFRPGLEAALNRSNRAKGGRPRYDAVLMFKVLVLQSLYTLSDDQTEYQIRDRLSFMRFLGLALHGAVPDAKTVWLFREQLVRTDAFDRLFQRFDEALHQAGDRAMGGQIIDATAVEARRPRLNAEEKEVVKAGSTPGH